MRKTSPQIWKSPSNEQLAKVLTSIRDEAAMQSFLRDVMTVSEIVEISARLEAARLLSLGVKYTEINTATGLSSRTIARISDWMRNGTGGYATSLDILAQHHAPTRLREA